MVWNSFPLSASTFVYICGPSGSACSANLVVVGMVEFNYPNYNLTGHRPITLSPPTSPLWVGSASSTLCRAGAYCAVGWNSDTYGDAEVYLCAAGVTSYSPGSPDCVFVSGPAMHLVPVVNCQSFVKI
eukprot:tig00020531_g10010.t1